VRTTFGPLDAAGRVPPLQQTRIAAFLLSAHGAEARLLGSALAGDVAGAGLGPWQIELHGQLCRELEIVSLLGRATSWQPDPMLTWLLWRWELAWLPQPLSGLADPAKGPAIDGAAFGYALHTAIRPAIMLPPELPATDPFGLALRRIETESGRIVQAQVRFLKDPGLTPMRDAIEAAVERRHSQLRNLWTGLLADLGMGEAP